jgi:thiol-disulfide isomerase/thioredoxin
MNKLLQCIILLICTSCFSQDPALNKGKKHHHGQKTEEVLDSTKNDSLAFRPLHKVTISTKKDMDIAKVDEVSFHSLTFIDPEIKTQDYFVVLFLGVDCPISQKYMNTVRILSKKYKDSITFFGIFPESFSTNEISEFKSTYALDFKLVKDQKNNYAALLKATHTPEVYLIDSNGKIKYQGAIDNWFYELGRNRRKVTEHYLENAIKAVFSGEKVSLDKTTPVGCFIEF